MNNHTQQQIAIFQGQEVVMKDGTRYTASKVLEIVTDYHSLIKYGVDEDNGGM